MTTRRLVRCLFALIVLAESVPAWGQTSAPPTNVRWWKETYVALNGEPKELRGRLLDLTTDTVAIDVDGFRRVYQLNDVARVQVRGDGVGDGIAAGMAIAFTMLCLRTCGQGLFSSSEGLGFVVGSFLYGGLIGAGVDALHTGRTTIHPARRGGRRAESARQQAVGFTFRF